MNDDRPMRAPLGKFAGEVYRKEIIAKLEKDEADKATPRSEHDKMMADARKRVLKRLKAIESSKKKPVGPDARIAAALSRYKVNAMEESYINVYGAKAEPFGTS